MHSLNIRASTVSEGNKTKPNKQKSVAVSRQASIIFLYMRTKVAKVMLWDTPQWGAADAEVKVPSGENTELKRSPFKARSRSVYSHTYHAYCHGFLPCLFLPFRSIHLHFFPKPLPIFSCVGCG